MPVIRLPGARLTYARSEEPAALLVQRLYEETLEFVQARWGIRPPSDLQITIVNRWWQLSYQAQGGLARILGTAFLPVWWYQLRWKDQWKHVLTVGTGAQFLAVKSPRLLPEEPLELRTATWTPGEKFTLQREMFLREMIVAGVVQACLDRSVPTWVASGLANLAARRLVGVPWPEPTSWEGVLARIGEDPLLRTQEEVDTMPQQELDELVARNKWPIPVLRYLEERYPVMLREMLDGGFPPQEFNGRLAARLGIDPQQLWPQLRQRTLAHLEGQTEDQPAVWIEPAATSDPDNPYAAPGTSQYKPATLWRDRFGALFILLMACLFGYLGLRLMAPGPAAQAPPSYPDPQSMAESLANSHFVEVVLWLLSALAGAFLGLLLGAMLWGFFIAAWDNRRYRK